MRVRLAFRYEEAKARFIVTAEVFSPGKPKVLSCTTDTIYDHENSFLEALIAADLDEGPTQDLAVAVVLSVAEPERPRAGIELDLTPEQAAIIGLNLRQAATCAPDTNGAPQVNPFSCGATPEDFHSFLMTSPTPFVMLSGPEHVVAFINPPYVQLLGRTSPDQLLGRPVAEAMPELIGQVCLAILDTTYKTGVTQVRRNLLSFFRQEDTGLMEEVYFDIIYQPLRDQFGNVSGVMAQATDVTERVLSRQVSEHREQKLYRLWAELEAIYHLAPIGLAVIDAASLTLLRLNRIQAEFLGGTLQSLTGAPLAEVPTLPPNLMPLLQQATAGTPVKNVLIETPASPANTTPQHKWILSVRPTLDAAGAVETLILVTLRNLPSGALQPCLSELFVPTSQ